MTDQQIVVSKTVEMIRQTFFVCACLFNNVYSFIFLIFFKVYLFIYFYLSVSEFLCMEIEN